ncbi:MAG: glycosyltransferase [Bacteroidetes bacterium]|nr:glycosyltransferase [Bacteroidota bacterium]
MSYLANKKIAIVHEWFDSYAGSERVVEQILNLFPQADLFALVDFLKPDQRGFLQNKTVTTTFIQKLPFARKKFRNYLAFFPLAVEQIDLRGYDIVISSSHAVAKGVLTASDQLHICYCHSPMRYAWDLYHQYLEEAGLKKGIKAAFTKFFLHYLRLWDQSNSNRVNYFVANSAYIAARIKNVYQRTAAVIYPPVNTTQFEPASQKADYYFAAARMVPYKKLDLIAEAFSRMPDKKLIIAGSGPELKKVKNKAGSNVTIIPLLSHHSFKKYLTEAKAFVYAAEEDFGIVMAEAQAAGVPVIAFKKGGAAEIVKDGSTGILFDRQSPESLIEGVRRFESAVFDPNAISLHAEQFATEQFAQNFSRYVDACAAEFFNLH